MPAPIRRKNSSVITELLHDPTDVPFFQAVRLLERAAVFANRLAPNSVQRNELPVGMFSPPGAEVVRFQTNTSLGFPGGEILHLEEAGDGRQQWSMLIAFLGLTGSTGILPFHYSETLFQRLKLKDQSMRDFFDLFNHRTVSLFFQSGVKYRLPAAYERHKLQQKRNDKLDAHTQALLSLIGLGTEHLSSQLVMQPESMIFYAGILSQQTKPASALKQMLSHYFDVPVDVQEFVGQWQDLIDDVRSRLPTAAQPKGQNARLGRSAILGSKGRFSQGKLRIVLGPLNSEQFHRFAPGTKSLASLNEMAKMYVGSQQECEYVLRVARDDLPDRIQLRQTSPPTIGWDTWLASKPRMDSENRGTMDITVSSGRLNH